MSQIKDFFKKGKEYGYLTYLKEAEPKYYTNKFGHKTRHLRGVFRCRCGNTIVTRYSYVKNGNTKACGCMKGKRDLK